jgi:hypothetical protein
MGCQNPSGESYPVLICSEVGDNGFLAGSGLDGSKSQPPNKERNVEFAS